MINFNAVGFAERRPEQVISFFWRSVYISVNIAEPDRAGWWII